MNTGKWTKEEKERFIKGVYKYSKNWKKVSLNILISLVIFIYKNKISCSSKIPCSKICY